MKILFLNHSSPLKEGGVETRTREVAWRMAKLGHQVTILCGKTQVDDPDIVEVNGVQIITKKILPLWLLRSYPYPHYLPLAAANLFLMFHLYFFLRKEKIDLVREDIAPFPPSFLLSFFTLPASPKRMAVVHMLAKSLKDWVKYYGKVFGFGGYLMNRLLRSGILKYTKIVSDAIWFADELKESPAIANRVYYVPNGVDITVFNKVGNRPSNGQVRLLSVGRLVDTKGHRYLIEALSHIKPQFPNIRLNILGNGPLKAPLLQLAKERGVDDMIEIIPPINHQQMPELLTQYDFFVMPSLWEGLPVSLIEAMASKLPIIATDIPAITDVLNKESAVFAEKENAVDLAQKLQWAVEHRSEVRRYAESAYAISKKFDWDTTARREIEGI
jgi:glycosyltransferase involved in cell wall biosynthesis